MAKIKYINVYSPAKKVDVGSFIDNDKPIFEPIDIIFVEYAYIGYYGYITKSLKNIEHVVSPRHRKSISFFSILSNYFIKKKVKIEKPAISISNSWYGNFYHFTLECLVKLFVLKEYLNNATLVLPSQLNEFHKQWIEILEIKKIICINENEVIETPLAISCNFPNRDLNHHHIILPEFREWILNKVKDKNFGYKKIFVGRKNGSKRNLTNQMELANTLSEFGFKYIELEDYSLIDQINIFKHCNQIVAVHGASLTHLTFCKPNTKVIDLIHENYNVLCFLKLSKILNINYQLQLCKGDFGKKEEFGYKDFVADIDKIISIINSW